MFRMPENVEKWFKDIFKKDSGALKRSWDLYYFCLLIGLSSGKREPVPNGKDIIDTFIEEYKRSQRLIIGLLITAELSQYSIKFTEKELVKKKLETYLKPNSQTNLSGEGFAAMNEYAWNGFLILSDKMTPPKHLPTFLSDFHDLLLDIVGKNKNWN